MVAPHHSTPPSSKSNHDNYLTLPAASFGTEISLDALATSIADRCIKGGPDRQRLTNRLVTGYLIDGTWTIPGRSAGSLTPVPTFKVNDPQHGRRRSIPVS